VAWTVDEEMKGTPFALRYPNIAAWATQQGSVELGYDPMSNTCARAIDEGGMVWGGGEPDQTIDQWLDALEDGVRASVDEPGLR
jgi:hypothetical protein